MFKIDKSGTVKDIKVRGSHPMLEDEARRIIKKIPTVEPGTQRGEPVTMPFSIPIVFMVN